LWAAACGRRPQHHRRIRHGRDDVFLNVRPLWPIAQVILMRYLPRSATVVLAPFDPQQFAAVVERPRNAYVAGCRRSWCAASILCPMTSARAPAGDPCRRLASARPFGRALNILGPESAFYG
jgi:hypothetical protein